MRIRHRDFSRGLWVSSSRDGQPTGTLRRATGIHPLFQPSIRSRFGMRLTGHAFGATTTQIVGFAGKRYAILSDLSIKTSDGTRITGAVQDTPHPSFVTGVPTIDTDATAFAQGPQHLIAAGLRYKGSNLLKIDTGGVPTALGIPAPSGIAPGIVGTKASLAPTRIQVIDKMDYNLVNTPWSASGVGGNLQFISEPRRSGSTAMQIQAVKSGKIRIQRELSGGRNFESVQGRPSSIQDWITLWVQVDRMANLDSFQITFGVEYEPEHLGLTGAFFQSFYYQVLVDSTLEPINVTGAADFPQFADENFSFETFPLPSNQSQPSNASLGKVVGESESANIAVKINSALAVTKLIPADNVWLQLRIPKKLFTPSDSSLLSPSGLAGWNRVISVAFDVAANDKGTVNVYVDDLELHGGSGIIGDYKYKFTLRSSKTGTRSNPNLNAVAVNGAQRNDIVLSNLPFVPQSIEPGVDQLEIWRTVGNGSVYFFNDKIPNDPNTLTYTDVTADFGGLTEFPTFITQAAVPVLRAFILPEDNNPVPVTCQDVVGPHFGRLFWTHDTEKGSRGRLYFSPPGRLEVVEGFINVTNEDDPTQKAVIWNGAVYVFSLAHCFIVEGSGPFVSTEIFGVPGTIAPATVVPTPYGIVYQTADGIRIFNGTASVLLFPEGVIPLFRGESPVNFTPFVGEIAAYYQDEYVIADGPSATMTLACNLRTGVWRSIGRGFSALHYEAATGILLVGALSLGTELFEFESLFALTSDGATESAPTAGRAPITFDVELPGTLVENQSGITKLVQRLYVDADTNGQSLAMEFRRIDSAASYTLPALQTTGRSIIEVALGVPVDVVSVRISGTLTKAVEIFGVEYDIHIPELALQSQIGMQQGG